MKSKGHASVNIEAGFLIAAKVRAHQYLLVLHAEVTLKCGKNHAYGCDVSIVRFLSGDVRLTRVLLLGSSEIFVQVIQEPAQEFCRVALSLQAELPDTDSPHFLQEFVWAYLTFE